MKQMATQSEAGFGMKEFVLQDGLDSSSGLAQKHAPDDKPSWPTPDGGQSLALAAEALVSAYIDVNLNFRGVALKEFMDDLEKSILVSCLRRTHGSQRNAAALLGIKPTALFEKLRKHHINARRIKLSERLLLLHPRDQA